MSPNDGNLDNQLQSIKDNLVLIMSFNAHFQTHSDWHQKIDYRLHWSSIRTLIIKTKGLRIISRVLKIISRAMMIHFRVLVICLRDKTGSGAIIIELKTGDIKDALLTQSWVQIQINVKLCTTISKQFGIHIYGLSSPFGFSPYNTPLAHCFIFIIFQLMYICEGLVSDTLLSSYVPQLV